MPPCWIWGPYWILKKGPSVYGLVYGVMRKSNPIHSVNLYSYQIFVKKADLR